MVTFKRFGGQVVALNVGHSDPFGHVAVVDGAVQTLAAGVDDARAMASAVDSWSPVSVATVRKWVSEIPSINKQCDAFLAKATIMGRPTPGFPETVDYPTKCGPLCRNRFPSLIHTMYEALLQAFANAFPPKSVHDDPLIVVEQWFGEPGGKVTQLDDLQPLGAPHKQTFAFVLAPMGRSGRFAADQDFLICSIVSGDASESYGGPVRFSFAKIYSASGPATLEFSDIAVLILGY